MMKFYKIILFSILLSTVNCTSQIYKYKLDKNSKECLEYTLNNYEYKLFYTEDILRSEGKKEAKQFLCNIPYHPIYYDSINRELLYKVLTTRYDDEFIMKIVNKTIRHDINKRLQNYQNLDLETDFLKKKFNLIITKLRKLQNSTQLDTVPKYKKLKEVLFKRLKNYKFSDNLVYAVAVNSNKDKRFVSLLKGFLKDSTHINVDVVKLSLSRLMYRPYFEKTLHKLKEKIEGSKRVKDLDSLLDIKSYTFSVASWLLTKEAILLYSKLLKTKYFDAIDHGDVSEFSLPVEVVEDLRLVIANKDFQNYYKGKMLIDYTKKDIDWAIKWFKNNKDNLQLNKDYIPYLSRVKF